jgi:hypothetical protein
MTKQRRRYPRVTCDVPAELTIDGAEGVGATIRSLTCDGLGLLAPPLAAPPGRDTPVTIRLQASGQAIELRGRVAWFEPLRDGARVNLGVRVEVEPSDAAAAEAWADWVVARIAAHHELTASVRDWHERARTQA